MAFVVEDGTGLVDATSYVSVEEADEYINIRTTATVWDDLDQEIKENLLIWSSQTLDQRVKWNGVKYIAESGLRWPRQGVYDRDGLLIPYDVIPEQLKEATNELAAYLLANNVNITATASTSSADLERIRVAVIELVYKATTSSGVTNANPIPPHLKDILWPLGLLPGQGGMNFVNISRA